MRRQHKPTGAVTLLLAELFSSDKIPPVTLAVIGLNVVIYLELFELDYPSLGSVCLSVNYVLQNKQWLRIILSAFFHGDDWHLYHNMTSFSMKGRSLERRYGSGYFLFLLAVFTVLCGMTLIGLELAAYYAFDQSHHLTSCAVGFSGVIFALKVLTTHNLPSGTVYMFGTIPVPSKYIYWVELVTISILTPNASFAGHLAGIIVGLLYVYGPLRTLMDFVVPYGLRRQNNYNEEDFRYFRGNYYRRYD